MTAIAIIHPTDLLTSELRDLLESHRHAWSELRLLAGDSDEVGTLTEVRGAAAMVQAIDESALEGVGVVFFGGTVAVFREHSSAIPEGARAIVLAPDAAPTDGQPIVAGVNTFADGDGPLLSPHPAVVALAHLLDPLAGFAPSRAAATIIEPASSRDRAGLDEVLDQTRAVLAFDGDQPREVFPVQMAFNVTPSATDTARLAAHLSTVLGEGAPPLTLEMLIGGIFHSVSVALQVWLDEDPGVEAVRQALAGHAVNELVDEPGQLGPIDAAGRDEVLVGRVAAFGDGGYRVWATMDNLTRGGSLNALAILEAIVEQRVS